MSFFAPELAVDRMSLPMSEGNYWTSNPVGGVMFEILLPPPGDVGVADLVAVVAFLVSYVAARAERTL